VTEGSPSVCEVDWAAINAIACRVHAGYRTSLLDWHGCTWTLIPGSSIPQGPWDPYLALYLTCNSSQMATSSAEACQMSLLAFILLQLSINYLDTDFWLRILTSVPCPWQVRRKMEMSSLPTCNTSAPNIWVLIHTNRAPHRLGLTCLQPDQPPFPAVLKAMSLRSQMLGSPKAFTNLCRGRAVFI